MTSLKKQTLGIVIRKGKRLFYEKIKMDSVINNFKRYSYIVRNILFYFEKFMVVRGCSILEGNKGNTGHSLVEVGWITGMAGSERKSVSYVGLIEL